MSEVAAISCTAFAGSSRIATGSLAEVARAAKAVADRGTGQPLLIFDVATSQQIEIDFRGTADEVVGRLAERFREPAGAEPPGTPLLTRRAGRPKLGVVGREITLLPRHWDWLASQPGGASVAIRRLIESARKANGFKDLARRIADTTYRFIHAIAGDFPRFEDVSRALFAGDREAFVRLTEDWPVDVREHARWLMIGGAVASDD